MVSLNEHLQDIDDDVAKIVLAVADITDTIHAELPHRRGKAGSENIYGEEQKALDVWTNDVLADALLKTGLVKTVISEELGEPLQNPDGTGSYTVTMDPLDGSSNIESNNLFGTIIGIHKEKDLLVPGKKQVCAFYNLYGPINTLVYCAGKGVHEFVKGRKGSKDFLLGRESMKLPDTGKLYGPGGLPKKWTPRFKTFVDWLVSEGKKLRYGGAFVGDFNQVLIYGGFFGYPELVDKPEGKLRLVIECNPMSYIMENAGGKSSNGFKSILEIKPEHVDQRVPVYVGNKDIISKLEEIFSKSK
ncbi:MAG: class 1 fructose-bisphosphatase [Candidatus Altiarchaeota archaeon]